MEGPLNYSFECNRQCEVMRAAWSCCHKGWGESTINRCGRAGQEIAPRSRARPSRKCRGRSELPGYVERFEKRRDPARQLPITHTMPLVGDQTGPSILMHAVRASALVIHFQRLMGLAFLFSTSSVRLAASAVPSALPDQIGSA